MTKSSDISDREKRLLKGVVASLTTTTKDTTRRRRRRTPPRQHMVDHPNDFVLRPFNHSSFLQLLQTRIFFKESEALFFRSSRINNGGKEAACDTNTIIIIIT